MPVSRCSQTFLSRNQFRLQKQVFIKQKEGEMHDKFNISKHYLREKIFIPQPPQQGQVWTNLNVTLLPDYLAYIKHTLTKQEQMLLSDYHLQTYLLETALKPHPKNDFDECTNQIVAHIRSHPQFWVRKKGAEQESLRMHQAIEQYHKDVLTISDCTKQSQTIELHKQYQPIREKKMIEDYFYSGNHFIKGAYRYAANLYPVLTEYVLGFADESCNKLEFRRLLGELLVNLGSKAKSRSRSHLSHSSEQSVEWVKQIEEEIRLFTGYAVSKNTEIKSLSSVKDYYLITNTLIIGKSLITRPSSSMLISTPSSGQIPRKVDELLADLIARFINREQLQIISDAIINAQYRITCGIADVRETYEMESRNIWVGLHSDQPSMDIEKALHIYGQIVNHPENTNRMKYKLEGSEVGWSDELYLKFLQKFMEYFNVPTNNKKIALAMGKNIEPNHVKHVKGIYMRNMAARIDNGEVGGGKKGIFESKLQFLKKDIQNFNIKWFKKQSKSKVKKLRRKRKRQTFDEEEHDSDY